MDSFFGFDATLPDENDDEEEACRFYHPARTAELHSPLQRRRCKEDISDEEEYDALNDETFGAADKGDWEDIHEHLVRLESDRHGRGTGSFNGENFEEDDGGSSSVDLLFDDYELDLQLSKLNLFYNNNNNNNNNSESGRSSLLAQSISDEFASKLRLDPSIWGSPAKVQPSMQQPYTEQRVSVTPFTAQPPHLNAFRPPEQTLPSDGVHQKPPLLPPGLFPPMKMLSVEDIERTIIQHQYQQNQHQSMLQKQMSQQQHHHHQYQFQQQPQTFRTPPPPPAKEIKNMQPMPMISSPVAPPLRVSSALMTPPPSLMAARNCALFPNGPPQPPPPPPMLNNPNRLPLGLLPYNMLAARPYSTPINNLAMHPAFPQRCSYGSPLQGFLGGPPVQMGPPPPLPPRHPGPPPGPFLMQRSPTPLPNNQFNQRLVQEIQQNHPMLAFNRQLANTLSVCSNGMNKAAPQNMARSGFMKQQSHVQQQQSQQRSRVGNGMPKAGGQEERDEYANMMSNRDKQWLIGIQLTQLNSDAPYFNDYYFTVYKRRLTAAKGEGENRIYRENQLNHPFTQPKENAQLLLLSLISKNGKSGQLGSNRERRSSESRSNASGNEGKDGSAGGGGRAYTPLQFQNSLGKLQCGSVIAPRKLIDADVMGSDQLNGNGVPTVEPPPSVVQRKARHVLLLIETLYKIVLKLEDLFNPVAVEARKLLREKKMRELSSSMACLAAGANVSPSDQQAPTSVNGNHAASESLEPAESYDELAASLVGQLSQDKITSILGVRKGRILLRRSLAVLHEHPCRWILWGMIFIALPSLPKKDRDDADGLLLTLFSEFELQLRYGTIKELLLVAKTIGTSRKVMQCIVSSKFLLSCIITVIFQMEMFCGKNPSALQKASEDGWWISFLGDVNRIVKENIGPIRSSSITINPDNNIVRTLIVHFARFGTRVDGTELLNFITDNGNGKPKSARKQSLQETGVVK
uniref:mRNA decay factor PAT1 domain-containing protein n=1 Tax=Anopheles christyi TaxID=43041 RepID=A0A182K4T9_9DIPT